MFGSVHFHAVHTRRSHPPFTPAVHTAPFTPAVHTRRSHPPFTPTVTAGAGWLRAYRRMGRSANLRLHKVRSRSRVRLSVHVSRPSVSLSPTFLSPTFLGPTFLGPTFLGRTSRDCCCSHVCCCTPLLLTRLHPRLCTLVRAVRMLPSVSAYAVSQKQSIARRRSAIESDRLGPIDGAAEC